MVFKCSLLWLAPYVWVGPMLFPLLDHSEENLSQNEWEDRLLQVSSPPELPPSTLASFSLFRILREESLVTLEIEAQGRSFCGPWPPGPASVSDSILILSHLPQLQGPISRRIRERALAVCPWASYLAFTCLRFFICKLQVPLILQN